MIEGTWGQPSSIFGGPIPRIVQPERVIFSGVFGGHVSWNAQLGTSAKWGLVLGMITLVQTLDGDIAFCVVLLCNRIYWLMYWIYAYSCIWRILYIIEGICVPSNILFFPEKSSISCQHQDEATESPAPHLRILAVHFCCNQYPSFWPFRRQVPKVFTVVDEQ